MKFKIVAPLPEQNCLIAMQFLMSQEMKKIYMHLLTSHWKYIRRFRNKCDIVEEPNCSSKHGVRVKVFSLIKRNLVF